MSTHNLNVFYSKKKISCVNLENKDVMHKRVLVIQVGKFEVQIIYK